MALSETGLPLETAHLETGFSYMANLCREENLKLERLAGLYSYFNYWKAHKAPSNDLTRVFAIVTEKFIQRNLGIKGPQGLFPALSAKPGLSASHIGALVNRFLSYLDGYEDPRFDFDKLLIEN